MKRLVVAFTFLLGLFVSPSLVTKTGNNHSNPIPVTVAQVLTGEVSVSALQLSLLTTADARASKAERRRALRKKRRARSRAKSRAKSRKYAKRIKRYRKRSRYSKRKRRARRKATVVAKIDISSQRMRVYENGALRYSWKVSTGKKGHRTPTGNYRPTRMYKEYYSKKYYNSPMPYSVFFRGGFAIHGTRSVRRLGRPASHGCVRLRTSNAAKLYSMIKRHKRNISIQITH